MGTTGSYGFKKNGKYKMTYSNSDSMLHVLGENVISFIKDTSIEEMNKIFKKIIMVRANEYPSEYYIEKYTSLGYDENRSYGETPWYDLIRNTQGDLNYYKSDLIHMVNNEYAPRFDVEEGYLESIEGYDYYGCEDWTYIINLDTKKLEISLHNLEIEDKKIRLAGRELFGIKRILNNELIIGRLNFDNIQSEYEELIKKYERFCEIYDKVLMSE